LKPTQEVPVCRTVPCRATSSPGKGGTRKRTGREEKGGDMGKGREEERKGWKKREGNKKERYNFTIARPARRVCVRYMLYSRNYTDGYFTSCKGVD